MKALIFALALILPSLVGATEPNNSDQLSAYVSLNLPAEMISQAQEVKGVTKLSLTDNQIAVFKVPALPGLEPNIIGDRPANVQQRNLRAMAIETESFGAVRRHTGL
ncbi:MAG: hypothetical protein HRT45_03960 [Bdellovibrionales bacterium]|nr:hypothetical protein [Bdellovibrionales bacterium]